MREVIRYVQAARKNAGLNVDDRIILHLATDDEELKKAIDEHADTIQAETLAVAFAEVTEGYQTEVNVEKAKLTIALTVR